MEKNLRSYWNQKRSSNPISCPKVLSQNEKIIWSWFLSRITPSPLDFTFLDKILNSNWSILGRQRLFLFCLKNVHYSHKLEFKSLMKRRNSTFGKHLWTISLMMIFMIWKLESLKEKVRLPHGIKTILNRFVRLNRWKGWKLSEKLIIVDFPLIILLWIILGRYLKISFLIWIKIKK